MTITVRPMPLHEKIDRVLTAQDNLRLVWADNEDKIIDKHIGEIDRSLSKLLTKIGGELIKSEEF